MNDDLVKRLREVGGISDAGATRWYINPDGLEAADRIQELEAALAHIWAWYPISASKPHETIDAIKDYAFAAIKGEKKDE